jgi:hypothetical protein
MESDVRDLLVLFSQWIDTDGKEACGTTCSECTPNFDCTNKRNLQRIHDALTQKDGEQ